MDLSAIVAPAVIAATVSGVVSIFGLLVNARVSKNIHREKLEFDLEQAKRKIDSEITISEKKAVLDRELAFWKRRTEFSEEVLSDFYKAQDIIMTARTLASFQTEGISRKREEWESEGDSRDLNYYFRTIERLNKSQEFFAQFSAKKHRFAALFGKNSVISYDDLFQIRGEIIMATQMLMRSYRHKNHPSVQKEIENWEIIIGWRNKKDDPIEIRLNKIISNVEEICRSTLDQGKNWL